MICYLTVFSKSELYRWVLKIPDIHMKLFYGPLFITFTAFLNHFPHFLALSISRTVCVGRLDRVLK